MSEVLKILLAEDEPHIARAVLTILKKGLPGYEINHARDGEEAMEMLLADDYVLVISDWNMPKINGDELLSQVREQEKTEKIPFILLTARGDRDSVVSALTGGAQDYIVKPFKSEEFLAKIRRHLKVEAKPAAAADTPAIAEKQDINLINEIVARFKSGKIVLPVLPDVVMKVNELFESDNADATTLAKVVEADVAISSKLINVANSPLVRGSSACLTVEQAIVRLGMAEARNYIFTVSNKGVFKTSHKALQKIMEELWEHSLASAYCAKLLALKLKNGQPEKLFVLGLLHDIGKLFLISVLNELVKSREGFTDAAIAEILTTLHAEFGAVLLKSWDYDQVFQDVARYHHQPFDAENVSNELLMIYLANLMVHHIGEQQDGAEHGKLAESQAAQKLGITAEIISSVLEKTSESMQAAKKVL